MKNELQQQLFDARPLFYRYRDSDVRTKGLHGLMELGICCGDGWYQLLLDVSGEVERIIENMKQQGHDEHDLPAALWVREKYGVLCIHIDNETSEITKLVEKTELKSASTCEVCGNKGKVRNHGWITCLCDDCHHQFPLGLDIDDVNV